ncbi:unnamed protein product [Adineta steineri]|uniref:Uncharacterized protein n=1 Tax=Adineta steineri TaxID=433720 RepID=A0A819XMQ9_9BILA|nr:unnamed protein product [Adineta steineri]CAF4145048.1 unnamed protein product [Adineta steineri]
MSSTFRQLYLFDCDGGRSSLFSEPQLDQLPNNCELYLFWNNIDEVITTKLQQLAKYHNVHLAPSHLKNCKNSADGKLIYFLGKLANEFSSITIVGGGDCVYEEVIEAVKYDYPKKEITLQKIEHPDSSKLEMLLGGSRSNIKNYSDKNDQKLVDRMLQNKPNIITRSIRMVLNQKYQCPECVKSHRQFTPEGLRAHLLGAKKHLTSVTDVSKVPVNVKESKMFCPKGKMKLILPSTGVVFESSKKGKKCPLCPTQKQKYKTILLYKHLEEKHSNNENVQIRCCSEEIIYKDRSEFFQHILYDPFDMTYKIHA